jgi:hypothetical protein
VLLLLLLLWKQLQKTFISCSAVCNMRTMAGTKSPTQAQCASYTRCSATYTAFRICTSYSLV